MLVNTVRENFKGFTKHEIEKATEARRLQGMIGHPTEREFTGMVREKLITNCPVIVHDINNANLMYGPDLANLRGKQTRTKPERVRVEIVQIPRDFVQLHKYVTLVADVMFVNGLPFLVTSSRGISLVTVEYLPSRTAKRLVNTLNRVFTIYGTAGFIVQTALMDYEFEKLKTLMPNVTLNTTAASEHMGEIERKIRVIKERAGCTVNTLPYPTLPDLMIIELMHFCVMWMNSFPVKLGISEKYSPREIIMRQKLDGKTHAKAPFGSYCEVREDQDITNTMAPRTIWAICLGPTGNAQGSYKFLSLATGKKLIRRSFTEMPVTESVINRVAQIAAQNTSPAGLSFRNRHGEEYEWDIGDEYELLEPTIDVAPFPDIPAEIPGVLTAREEVVGVSNVIQDDTTQSDQEWARLAAANSGMDFSSLLPETLNGSHDVIEILDDDEDDAFYDYIKHETPVKVEDIDDDPVTDNDPPATTSQDVDRSRHSGRVRIANRQFSDYEMYVTADEAEHTMLATVDKHTDGDGIDEDAGLAAVAHYIMVHYAEKENLKKRKKKYKPKAGQFRLEAGIKHFGERGELAVTRKELEQFNTYGVFEPKSASDLTDDDKRKALASLIFLKEKRNGDIKARSCANRSVQR